MKNLFLKNLTLFDKLFPIIARMPRFARRNGAMAVAWFMRRRFMKRGMPDRLTIFLTERCNLRCPHCFIDAQSRAGGREMGLDEYVTLFRKARGMFSQILFTGGEPTLREDLGDILVSACREGSVSYATLFSNGILEDRLVQAVRYAFNNSAIRLSFQVSLDGLEPFHDDSRGVDGAYGKTIHTMEALKGLKREFPDRIGRLAVATVISKRNLRELQAIISMVRATGFLHSFTFVRSSKSGLFNVSSAKAASEFAPSGFNDYVSPEEMEEALRILEEHLWRREPGDLYYATNRVILRTIAESLKRKAPQVACFSGLSELVLLSNGDVARCEMLRSFANIRDYDWDFRQLLGSEVFQRHLNETRGCWCVHDCSVGLAIMHNEKALSSLLSA
ncbi:MAG: radical SAM protein [Candidatus Omnitrophica bacterium]|nr:radical SAM protein [Candidatus Omnitrophota bacterium]